MESDVQEFLANYRLRDWRLSQPVAWLGYLRPERAIAMTTPSSNYAQKNGSCLLDSLLYGSEI